MAKIDVTHIEGYENMTAEDKIKSLMAYDFAEPDYSGYIKKDLFDKTASELSKKKKELEAKLTEDEAQKQKEIEERETLQTNYEKLLRESNISKDKAKLLALGYDEKLAEETAEAMVAGNADKIFENQKKHLEVVEKRVRADALKSTPKPAPDGDSKTMTLEKLKLLSPQERLDFSINYSDDYKSLYNGGKE